MNKVKIGKLDTLEYSINEAYKTLRTNISFCGDDMKVILLTSCTPNEGKSTVAVRLAQALAEDEKKVIVIDADLRKSVLIGRHGITSDNEIKGLSHYLSGQVKLDQAVCETDIDNMYMIFAGRISPSHASSFLSSSFIAHLLSVHHNFPRLRRASAKARPASDCSSRPLPVPCSGSPPAIPTASRPPDMESAAAAPPDNTPQDASPPRPAEVHASAPAPPPASGARLPPMR